MSQALRQDTERALAELGEREAAHPVEVRAGAAEVPLVYDSPHSGRYYPEDFRAVVSRRMLKEYEDRFVDLLIADAPHHGVTSVAANFPRAYIDPNRAPDDLDEEMFETVWPRPLAPSRHSRSGTGLIFRKMQDRSPIYDRRLSVAEAERRLEGCWLPYHEALEGALHAARQHHGAVWHVNWHSMRPVGGELTPDPGRRRADFVIGDRRGRSCEPAFTTRVREGLEALGYVVSVNDPYEGAYIVERHGRPDEGQHSLQIEINRVLYMDLDTLEKSDGFDRLKRDIASLTGELAGWARARAGA